MTCDAMLNDLFQLKEELIKQINILKSQLVELEAMEEKCRKDPVMNLLCQTDINSTRRSIKTNKHLLEESIPRIQNMIDEIIEAKANGWHLS